MFVNSIWSYYHLSWLWISLILHCYYDADRYETHELCELIRLCFKKKKENFLPFSFFFLSLVFLIKRLQCIGVIVRVTIYQYDSILVRNKISFGMTDFETGIWTTRFMRSHNLFLYLFFSVPLSPATFFSSTFFPHLMFLVQNVPSLRGVTGEPKMHWK